MKTLNKQLRDVLICAVMIVCVFIVVGTCIWHERSTINAFTMRGATVFVYVVNAVGLLDVACPTTNIEQIDVREYEKDGMIKLVPIYLFDDCGVRSGYYTPSIPGIYINRVHHTRVREEVIKAEMCHANQTFDGTFESYVRNEIECGHMR